MRLRKKFFVVLFPVVVAGLALQWAVSSYTQDRQMTRQRAALLGQILDNVAIRMIEERLQVLVTYGLDTDEDYVERYKASALDDLADFAARANLLFVITDPDGRVLQPTDLPPADVESLGDRSLEGGRAVVHNFGGEPYLMVARTFEPWGWTVAAGYSNAANMEAIQRVNLAVTGSFMLAGLGMALTLFIGFERLVIRPIRQLEEKVRVLRRGRQLPDLKLDGSDELAQLAAEMDSMANGIVTYMAELERSNSELDSFAATIGHDLRAPLRGISTIAGWLEADAERMPDTAADNLGRLREHITRMDTMLQELLRYAQSRQVLGPLGPCDIERLIEDQIALLSSPKIVNLTFEGTVRALHTAVPPLALVLRNLIENGISHHDRETVELRVSVGQRGDRVEFRVSDDGPGIPVEGRERIFDLFRPHERRPADSGIGLALVHRIIQRLGGRIRVESSSEPSCRGTTFVFDWPLDWPFDSTFQSTADTPQSSQLAFAR